MIFLHLQERFTELSESHSESPPCNPSAYPQGYTLQTPVKRTTGPTNDIPPSSLSLPPLSLISPSPASHYAWWSAPPHLPTPRPTWSTWRGGLPGTPGSSHNHHHQRRPPQHHRRHHANQPPRPSPRRSASGWRQIASGRCSATAMSGRIAAATAVALAVAVARSPGSPSTQLTTLLTRLLHPSTHTRTPLSRCGTTRPHARGHAAHAAKPFCEPIVLGKSPWHTSQDVLSACIHVHKVMSFAVVVLV